MSVPDLLHVTAEPLEDACLIRAVGEIDMSTVGALRREVDAARDEVATVLLDLSDVTFIDSTGLHLLLEASQDSADGGWGFVLVGSSAAVQRLIDVSGTADLLPVLDPRSEHRWTPNTESPTVVVRASAT
jgi:anti-sigma B factor antagonist